jgi:succinate dehydrogenase/fumarate reductase flavoprotein subunit
MSADRKVETDVLVIGGGLGGFFAAIKARESGVNVTVVEKAYAGKSGGAALGASWFAVFNPDWGHEFDTWLNFIVGIGEYLNNRDWVEIIVKESYARYCDLVAWGIPFASKKGRSPAAGSHAMPPVKYVFMTRLREKVLESKAKIMDRIMITDLLKQDGRVVGSVGFDTSIHRLDWWVGWIGYVRLLPVLVYQDISRFSTLSSNNKSGWKELHGTQ